MCFRHRFSPSVFTVGAFKHHCCFFSHGDFFSSGYQDCRANNDKRDAENGVMYGFNPIPKAISVYSVQRLAFKAESISEDVNTSPVHIFQTGMSNIIIHMMHSERPKA